MEKVRALGSHPFKNGLKHFEVSWQPVASGSQNPNSLFLPPAPFAVMLTKLAFFPRDNDSDRTVTFLDIAEQFLDVALGNSRLVLVVHENARLQRSAAGIEIRQDVVTVFCQLRAHCDARPRPRFFLEADLLQLSTSCRFRHLDF